MGRRGDAMIVDQVISPSYRTERLLGSRTSHDRGHEWADTVIGLLHEHQARTVLDYGCARGSLAIALREHGIDVSEYDPVIAGTDSMRAPADLVICTNVLEHVQPERIWVCAEHLATVTKRVAFVLVSTVATGHNPSKGREAHLLLRSATWWRTQLGAHGFVIWDEPQVRSDKQWVAVLRKRATC
jgi:2-polyprenyl-3-methyl-5-hydroxy-6-metoxy-1,4-benzoquinol methylase